MRAKCDRPTKHALGDMGHLRYTYTHSPIKLTGDRARKTLAPPRRLARSSFWACSDDIWVNYQRAKCDRPTKHALGDMGYLRYTYTHSPFKLTGGRARNTLAPPRRHARSSLRTCSQGIRWLELCAKIAKKMRYRQGYMAINMYHITHKLCMLHEINTNPIRLE